MSLLFYIRECATAATPRPFLNSHGGTLLDQHPADDHRVLAERVVDPLEDDRGGVKGHGEVATVSRVLWSANGRAVRRGQMVDKGHEGEVNGGRQKPAPDWPAAAISHHHTTEGAVVKQHCPLLPLAFPPSATPQPPTRVDSLSMRVVLLITLHAARKRHVASERLEVAHDTAGLVHLSRDGANELAEVCLMLVEFFRNDVGR